MKSAILSVGTELLFGQTVNTNVVYLSQQLNLLGFDVMYHYTVGDNPKRLEEVIFHAFEDCDLILTTGGLGPTQDDLTKEIACSVMGDHLVLNKKVLTWLEDFFQKLNREMTENNKKQAYFPSEATIFYNDRGTAPGFALKKDNKQIICLPGPPREMTHMFSQSVLPYLEQQSEEVIYYRMIRLFGIGESALETSLVELINEQTDPTLATYAKEGECSLRIASKRKTKQEAKAAVDEMLDKVKTLVGSYIYSCDDEELVDVVAKKLIKKNITISCAESCTGGMFAQTLADIPGISKVFDRGIVTYSNRAKTEELGISEETLKTHGAVSEETALEMVKGLQKVSQSDLCISVTGIAGPDGGSDTKPVGLIFIGIIYQGKTTSKKIQMRNAGRNWNRRCAVLHMLDRINRIL